MMQRKKEDKEQHVQIVMRLKRLIDENRIACPHDNFETRLMDR